MALACWLVPYLPFPGLPHIYFLFTVRLRIFHVCHNENFRNRYLRFYGKKWFYIWYVALAWWLVPCLPFPGLPHIYFPCNARFRIFHVCHNENFSNRYLSFYWKNDFIPPLVERGLYCNHLVHSSVHTFVTDISASTGRNNFYIWYMALVWWLVPCLSFPGLPHIYFLFTVWLRIFHVCHNENFRNRYLSFYWKKWLYIWYVALAWWLV